MVMNLPELLGDAAAGHGADEHQRDRHDGDGDDDNEGDEHAQTGKPRAHGLRHRGSRTSGIVTALAGHRRFDHPAMIPNVATKIMWQDRSDPPIVSAS
jgi:hypothetical protein